MRLSSGQRLGSYEIQASLGAGGMGDVYRATDTKLGRDVALKILPREMAADPDPSTSSGSSRARSRDDRLERFRREARAVAALNHPHIVTIFSIEEHGGVPFMTMELVEGRTLDQGIPGGGLSLARFFDIAIALADALSAAHRKHIIHRDLKPANVMVTHDGNVKVLDFGLARAAEADVVRPEEALTSLGLTQAGTIVGTMPYMSPEQIEAKPLDHRTDLFSLGIMLYEMATGERPFRGDSSPALMSSIMKDHPGSVGERRSDVPGEISRLIETARRAVQQDPESFVARWVLGISLGSVGRFEEAVTTLKAAAGISGNHPFVITSIACVFGQWGKPSEASALHRELMDRASRAYVPLAHLMATAEAAGQHEEAMAFARRAWDEREPPFILHARHFPEYRALHSDPRFAAILREMDSPEE